ncbi:hypothetical protein [Streptomyces sp. NPDC005547]|uniref:hypothetical protein n=1 Tax=unclassified Streptomyces TaxID=2593676 RepID=UPI0033BF38C7
MRRLATSLGALAAALTLGVAMPASAQAASGELYLNYQQFTNPSGCVQIPRSPLPYNLVNNQTDALVTVYAEPDCRGRIDFVVPGQEKRVSPDALSVLVHG